MKEQSFGSSSAAAAPPDDLDPVPSERSLRTVLDAVAAPVAAGEMTLTSGRRYELVSATDGDRLLIRSRTGEVVLRIAVTDEGPVLTFSGAALELKSSRRLTLSADEIAIESRGDISLEAGGSMREHVAGDHHLRVEGDERVEAAKVELQANLCGVTVRAMEKIALDGEHIALNDDPAPQPFPWSAIVGGPEED